MSYVYSRNCEKDLSIMKILEYLNNYIKINLTFKNQGKLLNVNV